MVGLAATGAQADDLGATTKFSGYGTLAGTVSNDSNAGFRNGWSQGKGAGSDLDLGVDSRFGVQSVTSFGQDVSVTAQLLAKRRRTDSSLNSNKDFDIGMEWLYAQYNVTPDLNVRLGRVVLPAYMISDSRNVGYAQPWLRAPLDVYTGQPLTNVDGVQLLWRHAIGPAIFTFQPSFGSSPYNISIGSSTTSAAVLDTTAKHVLGLNASLEWNDWLFRLGQVRGTSPLSLDLIGPQLGTSLPAANFDLKDRFTSAGMQYDNGKALFMAEITRRREGDMPAASSAYAGVAGAGLAATIWDMGVAGKPLAATTAWYVAGGWHFNQLLPVLAVGQYKDELLKVKYHSLDASLRYDLRTNVALKMQVSRYQANDSNAFLNPTTDAKRITVVAFGMDFVF
jgi:hypothetical protein